MNRAVVDSPSYRTEQQAFAAAASLVWWHAGWLALLALGAALLLLLPIAVPPGVVAAVAVGACPALAGLFLAKSRRPSAQVLILVNWGVAGLLAASLTGGLAGPLAVWLLAPLAAGGAIARPERLALAAAVSIVAFGLCGLAGLTLNLPAAPDREVATALGAVGLSTTLLGLAVGLVVLQRNVDLDRRRRGLTETRLREALGEQPHLLVSVFPSGKLAAAWGNAPRELKGQISVGRPLAQLAAAPDRPRIEAALRTAMSEGQADVAFAPPGAAEPWLELTLRRVNPTRVMGAIRDARSQRDREAELERARAEAEAQNANKSRFLANMSHELRTPLNAIMGFSDIMRQRLFGPMPDRYGEYSELIHESGVHLLELINDVLDMSKIEAERFELHREEFDVREAANAVLRLMRGQADRAGVQLRGVLPREPLDVDADRRAIKQIALNLISNALKFTPKGGAVTMTLHAAGPVLEILVADTGAGISAEDIQRLGRPFEQAGGQDQRAIGTGLGLSLVRAFAELHGGEMVIESRLGEGTTVIVRMPVVLAEAATA